MLNMVAMEDKSPHSRLSPMYRLVFNGLYLLTDAVVIMLNFCSLCKATARWEAAQIGRDAHHQHFTAI